MCGSTNLNDNGMNKAIGVGGIAAQAGAGLFSAGSSLLSGNAKANYYDYLAEQDKANAKLSIQTGDSASSNVQAEASYETNMLLRKNAKFNASQAAAMAGNGVDLSSVSAQDVTLDTLHQESLDEQAIRYNADKKTAAIRNDALMKYINYSTSATMNTSAAGNAAAEGAMSGVAGLLTTAGQFANNYAKGKKEGLFDLKVDHPSGELSPLGTDTKNYLGTEKAGSLTVPFAQGRANDSGINRPWASNAAQTEGPTLDLIEKMNPSNGNFKTRNAWGLYDKH